MRNRYVVALKTGLLCLACLGMVLPTSVLQAADAGDAPPRDSSIGLDVILHEDGLLQGQVVDVAEKPLAGTPVSLRFQGREVAAVVTDESGGFRFRGVQGGVHQIVAGNYRQICRTWDPNAAPPSARARLRIVLGDGPIRGQSGPIGYWLGNPWVIAGLVAVAVAIPVAIHNHRSNRPASQ